MNRYRVQFTATDRRRTSERHYYVKAQSPEAAITACLRDLSIFECLSICNRNTIEAVMPC